MKKLIFCNLDLIKVALDVNDYEGISFTDADKEKFKKKREKFIEKFHELSEDTDNKIYFYSRKADALKGYESLMKYNGYTNFVFKDRSALKEFVTSNKDKNNYFVFVGAKNKDFELAVNTRSLFIVPTWLPLEDRPARYGIHVDSVKQLYKFILTLNNQNTWYSRLEIDDISTAYSLMDARYGKYAETMEEKEMVENFQKLLKENRSQSYRRILLYHFLAGMTNTMDFDDIELFGMIPSSSCRLNEYVFDFMNEVRLLKGKQLPKRYPADTAPEDTNLLIRHTAKTQAHIGKTWQDRIRLGCKEEFATLCINPDYKKRIEKLKAEGRFNVCIFDDYMTHGNSFNAVRNLLKTLGANKIVFVSLGLFRNPFQKKDYTITGNVYGKDYTFQLETVKALDDFEINNDAKKEVSDLHDIFYA